MNRLTLVLALAGCNVPLAHFTGGGDGGSGDLQADAEHLPPGDFVWIRSLSQIQTQTIASGASGIVTPAYLYTTANINGTLLTSAGNADLVIAEFTEADGTNLYAVDHGNVGSEFGLLAIVASNGNPMVSGVTEGDKTIDLGLGPLSGGGTPVEDGYIGAYSNGVADWDARLVGPGSDKFLASARGPGSTIWGAGWFEPSCMFIGPSTNLALTSAGGRDAFLVNFNIFTGAVNVMKQYGGAGRDEVSSGGVATLDTDLTTLVLSGFYDNAETISFGGTAAVVTSVGGGLDMWIAKLDSTGTGIWAVTYGGPGDDRDVSVVLDAKGDVYLTGTFTTSISFGTIALTSVGGVDHFIAKLDGTNGSPIWAISFGSVNNENAGRIAVDNNGHVAWTGNVAGALNGMATDGGLDAYLAEFSSADGSKIWDHLITTGADDSGAGVAYGKVTGDLFVSISTGAPYSYGMPIIGPDQAPLDVLIRVAP